MSDTLDLSSEEQVINQQLDHAHSLIAADAADETYETSLIIASDPSGLVTLRIKAYHICVLAFLYLDMYDWVYRFAKHIFFVFSQRVISDHEGRRRYELYVLIQLDQAGRLAGS